MQFTNVPKPLMVYGSLFSLTNRLQKIGDGYYKNLTLRQHFILMVILLFNNNYPSLKDVAQIVGCSYQNVKKIIDLLERKQFINVKKSSYDKRKYVLVPTAIVSTVTDDMSEQTNQLINELFKGINSQETEQLFLLLQKMETNLKGIENE